LDNLYDTAQRFCSGEWGHHKITFPSTHVLNTDRNTQIVSDFVKERSNLRLVLAAVALGMGLNAPCIQRIIHCKPPTTMEKYMQEIGRAGRKSYN
jgi:superfamily II DNA helicase RecQ